jgi:hypothetical protein
VKFTDLTAIKRRRIPLPTIKDELNEVSSSSSLVVEELDLLLLEGVFIVLRKGTLLYNLTISILPVKDLSLELFMILPNELPKESS